jgi:antirestriction protein
MPSITYYELSNYNNGILIPESFELSGCSYDDHLTEIQEWLDNLTESHKEKLETEGKQKELDCFYDYEEWIVCDYEDIPDEYVGTWSIDSEFFDYLELVESSHLDNDAIKAGIACGIPLDKIEDAYYGYYESDSDLADDHLESGCFGDIPKNIHMYIDTERLGRDLAYDFLEDSGHYFHANY